MEEYYDEQAKEEYNKKKKEQNRFNSLKDYQKEIEKTVKDHINNLNNNKSKFNDKRKLQIEEFIKDKFGKIYSRGDKLIDDKDKIKNIDKLYKFILFSDIKLLDNIENLSYSDLYYKNQLIYKATETFFPKKDKIIRVGYNFKKKDHPNASKLRRLNILINNIIGDIDRQSQTTTVNIAKEYKKDHENEIKTY